MSPNLLDLLRRHAATTPEAPCLTLDSETLSFRDLNARSSRLANALIAQGVKPGDRIAVIARNALAHYELFFGCAKAEAILLPVNWRLAPREIAAIMADAEPRIVIVEEDLRPLLADLAVSPEIIDLAGAYSAWRDGASATDPGGPTAPDDPQLILYTSGTTGLPKGVMLSHDNLSYLGRMAQELWAFGADSVNLVSMPLFHIGGIGYGMTGLSQGGHTVLMQQVVPVEIIDAFRAHGVTHAFFVPTVVQMLLDVPGVAEMNLTSLQRILYGGAPISEAVLKRAIDVFGCGFMHTYGMTETAGTVVMLASEDHDPGGPLAHRLRSCGRPMPWVELALIDPATGDAVATGDVGEIRIRSAVNMLGYWRKPGETADAVTDDGWLRTGDAAYRDADGYIYIHDRFKDMIVSGGENIYPTEVENVLYDHPHVAAVAVIGVPHPRWGETPKAYVVAKAGASPTEAALIAFTRERLAHYKCPTAVAFVAELPRNASGKILKREMRDAAWMQAQ